jgi:uncharacterized protein (DUF2062 family)
MNRKWLRALSQRLHRERNRWYLRPVRTWIMDSRLWSLQRRSITLGFGVGLAICFVPLPVHFLLGATCAIAARLNVPVTMATTLLVNPVTVVPIYFLAYRVGATLLGVPHSEFSFELSWDWLQHGLGPMWKPFLTGCVVSGLAAGLTGYAVLEFLWQRRVRKKYRERRDLSSL